MASDLNLGLRIEILNSALKLEALLNDILVHIFSISDKDKTRNFGTKAGISFKSKIDLLYDLGYISKEQWQRLELQMVFRNKFLHDIECTTFVDTFDRIDVSQKNKLLEHSNLEDRQELEKVAYYSYKNLFNINLQTLIDALEKKQAETKAKQDALLGLLENSSRWANHHFSFIRKITDLDESIPKEGLISKLHEILDADLVDVKKLNEQNFIIPEEALMYFAK